MNQTMSIYEAAKALGKSPATVKEMIYMGRLPAEKVKGSWKIQEKDIAKLLRTA